MRLKSYTFYFDTKLTVKKFYTNKYKNTWKPILGEYEAITNHYNKIIASIENELGQKMTIQARAHNDGIGFRYFIPN